MKRERDRFDDLQDDFFAHYPNLKKPEPEPEQPNLLRRILRKIT